MHLTAYDWSSTHYTHTRYGQHRPTAANGNVQYYLLAVFFSSGRKGRTISSEYGYTGTITVKENLTKITKTIVTDNNGRGTDNGGTPAVSCCHCSEDMNGYAVVVLNSTVALPPQHEHE
jgi:hypothetical protein